MNEKKTILNLKIDHPVLGIGKELYRKHIFTYTSMLSVCDSIYISTNFIKRNSILHRSAVQEHYFMRDDRILSISFFFSSFS